MANPCPGIILFLDHAPPLGSAGRSLPLPKHVDLPRQQPYLASICSPLEEQTRLI